MQRKCGLVEKWLTGSERRVGLSQPVYFLWGTNLSAMDAGTDQRLIRDDLSSGGRFYPLHERVGDDE
jgi:hypothetical protein